MTRRWPVGFPTHFQPDHPDHARSAVALGAVAMQATVFLSLIGYGIPVREALAATVALGLAGTELAHRLRDRDDDGPTQRRQA